MTEALIITAPAAMTAPLPDTPILTLRGDTIVRASDGFSGSPMNLGVRTMDAAAGGTQEQWKVDGSGSSWITTGNGRLSCGPASGGTFFAYITSGESAANREVEVSLRIVELASANFHIDLFRDSASPTQSRKMRLTLPPSGNASLSYSAPSSLGETGETVSGSGFNYASGDLLAVRYNTKTGTYRLSKNGAAVKDGIYIPAVPVNLTGNMFGFAGSTGMSSGILDDFKVSETII